MYRRRRTKDKYTRLHIMVDYGMRREQPKDGIRRRDKGIVEGIGT